MDDNTTSQLSEDLKNVEVDEQKYSRIRIATHNGFVVLECTKLDTFPQFRVPIQYKLTKKDARELARVLTKSTL